MARKTSGEKPTSSDSLKPPRRKRTSKSQENWDPNISYGGTQEMHERLHRELVKLVREANPVGVDVLGAVASGMGMSATIADMYPLSRPQAEALLLEFERTWITDREIIVPLMSDLRRWVESFRG